MKYWKYKICNRANTGTEENPNWYESFVEKMIPATESNEEIAKSEAYNGEYEIFDDGISETIEPSAQDDTDAMLVDHEYRLTLLELGVTE